MSDDFIPVGDPGTSGTTHDVVITWKDTNNSNQTTHLDTLSPYVSYGSSPHTTNTSGLGWWQAIVHYDNTYLTPDWQSFLSVSWTERNDGFKLTYQTSTDGVNWSDISGPIVPSVADQIKLKAGKLEGSITTNELTYSDINVVTQWTQYKTNDWYDGSGGTSSITYTLLIWDGAQFTASPITYMSKADWTNLITSGARVKVKITLKRRDANCASPYVNQLAMRARCVYSQEANIACTISAVSNGLTGTKDVATISSLGFSVPAPVTAPTYSFVNNTQISSISMYWLSQVNAASRTETTTSGTDHLIVKCVPIVGPNQIHKLAASTSVTYPDAKQISLVGKTFTPSLITGTSYEYYALLGTLKDSSVAGLNNYYKTFTTPEALMDPSSYGTQATRINFYWEDQNIGSPKPWNMLRDDLAHRICFDIIDPVNLRSSWKSSELVFYEQTINAGGIKQNYFNSIANLPPIARGIQIEGSGYLLAIMKSSVKRDGVVVDEELLVPLNEILKNDTVQALEYTLTTDTISVDSPREELTTVSLTQNFDYLPYGNVTAVRSVWDGGTTYTLNTDWTFNETDNTIEWISANRPDPANAYQGKFYVDITYTKSISAVVNIKCDYYEPIINRIPWISSTMLTGYGIVPQYGSPTETSGLTTVERLYLPKPIVNASGEINYNQFFGDVKELFPDIYDGDGNLAIIPKTFYYNVENNNQYVESRIENYEVVHEAKKDIVSPWNPYIHNGYYYIGDQRYYKYAQPAVHMILPSSSDPSKSSLPSIPKGYAPIIVKTDSGRYLRKVAFTDPYSGDFVLYNREKVEWQKLTGYDHATSTSYIRIKVAYDDLDLDNFTTILYNGMSAIASSSTPLTSLGGLEVHDNIIYANVDQSTLYNADLSVLYKPNHAFTYDFNKNEIQLSQVYNEVVYVYYESSEDNYDLIESIDVNPMFNYHHSGFMYIQDISRSVATIKAHIAHPKINADGKNKAYINIITLDEMGNPVDLEVNQYGVPTDLTAQIDLRNPLGQLSQVKRIGFGEFYCIYTTPIIPTNRIVEDYYVYINIKSGNAAVKKQLELVSVYS